MISTRPIQKVGTEDRDRHDDAGGGAVRTVAGIDAGGDAEQRRAADSSQRQLQRRRQPRQDELQHRHAEHEGPAEIALQDAAEEGEVLFPERPVEPVAGNGVEPDVLADIGPDQHVDRIADRVDADEDQRRHDEHDDESLNQASSDMA
jgi:hypothetical protein